MINLKDLADLLAAEGIETTETKNGNRDALAIGSAKIRPMVYADRFDSMDDALNFARELAAQAPNPLTEFAEDMLASEDFVRKNLKLSVRPVADDGVLTRPLHDLELYAYLVLQDGSEEMTFCNINESHIGSCGITEDELFDLAKNNTEYQVLTIQEIMQQLLVEKGVPYDMAVLLTQDQEGVPMYVITTPNRLKGASALADPNNFFEIAEHLDSDLLIFPASVHELIVTPYDTDLGSAHYRDMVKDINANDVDENEVLSDNVYLYTRSTGTVSIL